MKERQEKGDLRESSDDERFRKKMEELQESEVVLVEEKSLISYTLLISTRLSPSIQKPAGMER